MSNAAECIELDDSSDDDSSVEATVAHKKPPPAVASRASLSVFDDSDDSDDSLLRSHQEPVFANSSGSTRTAAAAAASRRTTTSRTKSSRSEKPTKEEREEERRKERERKEQQKLRDKKAREEERARKRAEKEASKRAEQEAKRRRVLEAQQTSGKFAPQEIALLVEPLLLQKLDTEELQETYAIHPHSPHDTIPGSVQWIRKDYTAGGAQDAIQALQRGDENGYQLLERMVICFYEPQLFISLLEKNDDDDDYPLLESWLESLNFNSKGKLVLLLHQVTDALHREWNNAQRQRSTNKPPPTDADLNDAMVWLLIQFQVECIVCDSQQDILKVIKRMTRSLSESPYQQQVTELECVRKIKSSCADSAAPLERAMDCWIRQLQQIPMISEAKARHLAQYFPTARSLWDVYQDPSRTEDEKRLLLAPLFQEGRQYRKLSDIVYRLMTSTNPKEFL